MNKQAEVNSQISPLLNSIVYPLGCYLVIPLHFGKIEIRGQEHIPKSGPVILAPTHRSRWDALIVPYATGRLVSGRNLRFMVSAHEIKGLQGWFISKLGGFPVDPARPGASSFRHSVELLSEGEMLVIFPEGAIGRERKIKTIKRGVARIALEVESEKPNCGIKILPISIKYSQTYPTWGCDILLEIAKPINVKDYSSDSIKKSTEHLTNALENSLRQIHEEETESKELAIN